MELFREAKAVFLSNEYFIALGILLGAMVVALLVNLIVTKVLYRLASKTHTQLDDKIIAAIQKPLFFSVVLAGIAFALRRFDLGETWFYVTDGVALTLGILVWAAAAMKIGHEILETLSARIDDFKFVQPRTLPLFEIAVKILIVGSAAYSLLLSWDVDVTAWLASAGILGIAIGFAAKDTLSNFFAGIFIVADTPYKLGDFIILDSGERGRVTDIGIRSTRLLTRDDIEIIIPNSAMGNAKVINETGGPEEYERVRVRVGVAYGSDIDQVREILLDVAAQSQYVAEEPAPRVRFREFGDSALQFQLMGWIKEPVLRGRALDELNTAVYKRFGAEGIKIPFPQRTVHMQQA
jgi:small-conductance mechanosensitive channel